MAGLKVITPPAAEPVKIEEVRAQLRIELDDESYDDILQPLITAAREWCEGYQNRAYVEQTLELALDYWPRGQTIELPRPPLRSVTSVVYGSETWDSANYAVDDYSFIGRIVAKSWPPGALPDVNGIKVRYVAGYEPVEGEVITGESLGTGDGEQQTYTVSHYPVKLDSVTLYFDGTPTSSYTIDYDTGTVTCAPAEGVVVTIDYTEATDCTANVPQRIKQAILLLVTHWFDNGMCDPPPAVYSLLNLERVVPV